MTKTEGHSPNKLQSKNNNFKVEKSGALKFHKEKKHRGKIVSAKDSLELYLEVAQVLDNMKDGEITFKEAFAKSKIQYQNLSKVYAIALKVVNNWKLCNSIVEESGILIENPSENKNAIKAIIADYLWGSKRIVGQEWIFNIVRSKKDELDEIKQKFGNFQYKEKGVVFVRVNTIKYSSDEFINELKSMDCQQIETPDNYSDFLRAVSQMRFSSFMIDFHFKDLFVFPDTMKSKLRSSEIIKNKSVTFQDKSSLISVKLLNVEPGSTVLDMCAAPGMKTVYLAACLQGNGEIFAVDRDKKRYQTLVSMVKSFGAGNIVKTCNQDITKYKCDEQSIDYVLLDAPCSGSGIRDRLGETETSDERFRSLQWLQFKMLTTALTKYTTAKRIVYSTCSTFTQENEAVIDMALKKLGDDIKFRLVDCHKLIEGYNGGSSHYEFGPYCIRVDTNKDLSNGFFTALFENLNVTESDSNDKLLVKMSKQEKNKLAKKLKQDRSRKIIISNRERRVCDEDKLENKEKDSSNQKDKIKNKTNFEEMYNSDEEGETTLDELTVAKKRKMYKKGNNQLFDVRNEFKKTFNFDSPVEIDEREVAAKRMKNKSKNKHTTNIKNKCEETRVTDQGEQTNNEEIMIKRKKNKQISSEHTCDNDGEELVPVENNKSRKKKKFENKFYENPDKNVSCSEEPTPLIEKKTNKKGMHWKID